MNIKDFNSSSMSSGMRDDMKCSFCLKNQATCMWTMREGDALFCCTSCAVSVLPAIMADSFPKSMSRMVLNWYVEQAVSAFWKAMAIRFIK